MSFRPIGLCQQTVIPYSTTAKRIQAGTQLEGYSKTEWKASTSGYKHTFAGYFNIVAGQDYDTGGGVMWSEYIHFIVEDNSFTLDIGIADWNDLNTTDSNRFYLRVQSAGSTKYQATSQDQPVHGIASGDWFAMMLSVDTSAAAVPTIHWWVRKVGGTAFNAVSSIIVNQVGPHLLSFQSPVNVGEASGTYDADYDISQFYFDFTDVAVDWSLAENRNKFCNSSTGKPMSLGSTGYVITGNVPKYYSPDGDLTNNLGTGGNFTETGTVSAAPTSPSD